MELREKIRRARKTIGKSQEGVAKEIGVSLRTYQQYERGNVKPKKRRVLEKALSVPVGYLDDQKTNPVDQTEYIKTIAQTLIANGELSDVDLKAFINEMCEIIEDAKKRRNCA